jgi:amino acid transporter
MENSSFTKIMLSGFIIFSTVLAVIIFKTNPEQGDLLVGTFISIVFFVVFCFSSLFAFLIRRKLSNNEAVYRNMKSSMRQGLLLGLLFSSVFVLGWFRLLVWWDVLIIMLALLSFDLYYGSITRRSANRPRKF